ncbi:LytTR family transcriptional regulator DNA-binding domain-containing protein [Tetragenococcus halophilus]|nr:LytTR family transcriptional regulator DNA-binding domain-containing protein [Tetragenococcus halophilus]
MESNLHKVHFKLTNSDRSLYLYGTLNGMQNKLAQDHFVRIHQSYLVNLKHLINAKNYKATLTQGIELPISQNLFSKVKQRLLTYKTSI